MRKTGQKHRKRRESFGTRIRKRTRTYRIIGFFATLATIAAISGSAWIGYSLNSQIQGADSVNAEAVHSQAEMERITAEASIVTEKAVSAAANELPSEAALTENIGETAEPQESEASTEPASAAESETSTEPASAAESEASTEPTSAAESETSTEPASVAESESTTEFAAVTESELKPESIVQSTSSEKAEETETEETLSQEDLERRMVWDQFENLGMIVGVNNYLNIRRAPSTDAEIDGKIFKNCGVNVLEVLEDGWVRIESGGATGYVAGQYVATGEEAKELALECAKRRISVTAESLNVRSTPEIDESGSNILTSVNVKEQYDVMDVEGDWVKIQVFQGLEGYVYRDYVKVGYYLDEAIIYSPDGTLSQARQNLINLAFEYYGGRYEWGGRDLDVAVDCSGYTLLLFNKIGIQLSDTSYTQVYNGVEVSEEDIRPGDLLFYIGRFEGQIGHVAIYIGNGKIIHAASEAKGICVSDWKFVPIMAIRNVFGD